MKTTLAALLTLATIASASAQSGPPSAEVRALRQTNSELMQAWVGARTALADAQDKIDIANHKIEQLETLIPARGNVPTNLPNMAAPPTAPAEK